MSRADRAPAPRGDDPDPEIVAQIRAGDRAAFERVFAALYPGLRVYVARWIGSADAAQDIVQDLFLAIWQHRAELQIHQSLATYLFRAARNRAFNYLRGARSTERMQSAAARDAMLDATVSVDDAVAEAEIARVLERAIAALPPKARQVFTMHRQRGLTYREISVTLGIAPKTVEAQMARALRHLRERLRRFFPTE